MTAAEAAGPWGDGRRVRIGLLGGSFNPAHEGHRHVAERALAALGLDQVWLLVSPGNPLKPSRGMAPFAERLASARRIADGRRIVATGIEARLGRKLDEASIRAMLEVHEDYLARFHEVAGEMAGSFDGWLERVVGVGEDLRERLRAKFIA